VRTLEGKALMIHLLGNPLAPVLGGVPFSQPIFMGVSEDTRPPQETDTKLAGELSRVQATFGWTQGTGSYTLTRMVTAEDRVLRIAKIGIFNRAGTMAYVSLLDSVIEVPEGEQTSITEQIIL
jgi:hypothetical protein